MYLLPSAFIDTLIKEKWKLEINRIMKDRVRRCFFSYVFSQHFCLSSFKKFLQLPSSRTNIGRLWNSIETGGTCWLFQPGVAEVGRNICQASQKLRRQPPLTQDLRLDHQSEVATNCGQVFKEMMMISCWHLHPPWLYAPLTSEKKSAGKWQFEARTYVEFKPST